MKKKLRVGIIGGGIFGTSAAIELAKNFKVTLFERGPELLRGATYANHNRHHYGFHYPRSRETARQCLSSRKEFESIYGGCLDFDFDHYYCVSKENTKTSPSDYLKFCRDMGLEFEEVDPDPKILDPSKIALCLKGREGVYDISRLRALVLKRMKEAGGIEVKLNAPIVGGHFKSGGKKVLTALADGRKPQEFEFDFVVSAIYGHTNQFCRWFGFRRQKFQFNLQELDVVELPLQRRIGVTVQDGPFPSIIPIANSYQYLMAHVIESQLVREISEADIPLLYRTSYVESNWERVLAVCREYIPILKDVKYVKSIFVDRVVDSKRLKDDARLTELTDHGKGCYSIFAAKVITCVTTAKKLAGLIRKSA